MEKYSVTLSKKTWLNNGIEQLLVAWKRACISNQENYFIAFISYCGMHKTSNYM